MTIEKYLSARKMSRADFLDLLEAHGWRPTEATLSRWISGKAAPGPAAIAILRTASGGKIVYG